MSSSAPAAPNPQLPEFRSEDSLREYRPPNPAWKVGDGATRARAQGEPEDWERYKKLGYDLYAEGRSPFSNYFLAVTAIAPKPIGLISTVSKTGEYNLAPYSYFGVVCHNPLIMVVGASKGRGRMKDTARNLHETGEATINIISEWLVEAANSTSMNAPPGVSEWTVAGLHQAPSTVVRAPHVAESAVSIEATVHTVVPIASQTDPGDESGDVFLLKGVYVHAREDLLDNTADPGVVDTKRLRPVVRLGHTYYGRLTQIYEMEMPRYDADRLAEDLACLTLRETEEREEREEKAK